MIIQTVSELRAAMRHGPYAWPGGYPCFFVTEDGEALSFEAVRDNRRAVIDAVANRLGDGWRVIGLDINWEGPLYCAHTGRPIPSAYGEDAA
jgi:hypothetical protein